LVTWRRVWRKTDNLCDRLAERRRAALDQWSEFVQSLAEGKVVPIGKGAATRDGGF
jgi:hypothetical protein